MTVIIEDNYDTVVFTDVFVDWNIVKSKNYDKDFLFYDCCLSNGQSFLVKTKSPPSDSNLWSFHKTMKLKKNCKFFDNFKFEYFYEICYE